MTPPELVSRIAMSPVTMWLLFAIGMRIAARRIH